MNIDGQNTLACLCKVNRDPSHVAKVNEGFAWSL